jgi:hypothetical protein
MLRKDMAAKLLQHRENDIKIGLHGDDGVVKHVVVIEDVAYDSDLDVIMIKGHRTFPEDVADDMQRLIRELDRRLEGLPLSSWYDEWRSECADALGLSSVDDL